MTAIHSMRTGWSRRIGWVMAMGLIGAWLILPAMAPAQQTNPPPQVDVPATAQEEAPDGASDEAPPAVSVAEPFDAPSETAPSQVTPRQPRDPKTYGLWVLLPAIVAILLAIFTRQVVPALVVGVFVGAYMIVPCLTPDSAYAESNSIVAGFRLACEKYVVGAIIDSKDGFGHVKIMVFTLIIGFMVGVIGRNGGTAGIVKLIAGNTDSPRRGALTAWFAGLVVFFDDYANTMIVGPTMRSVFDRLKISRAKLAYIVDSTAAPVASLALVGTWVGAEIGFINEGLDDLAASGAPAFMLDANGSVINGMTAFVSSLPYRFYPILALVLVFWVSLTGRDFGPMKRAQLRAATGDEERPYEAGTPRLEHKIAPPRWWLGLLPVLVLLGATVLILYLTGTNGQTATPQTGTWWEQSTAVLNNADPYQSIFYGAVLAAIAAVVLTLAAGACSTRDAVEAGLEGMSRMFPAIVILVLAWAISQVEQDLSLGYVVSDRLRAADFPVEWIPLAVFASAAGISFATGTSWTTMGILCPVTVSIMANMAAGLDPAHAQQLFYAAVGSVLAGAIFGDHCSPISDTTVLSSIASGCRHESHVWTQIPYAVVTAIVAMGMGDVACNVYGQPWYYGLAAGMVVLLLIVLIFGRRPKITASPRVAVTQVVGPPRS